MDYLPLVVIAFSALSFYRAGVHERSWGLLWAALSIAVSLLAWRWLRLGMFGVLGAQAALFLAITAWRMRAGSDRQNSARDGEGPNHDPHP